jgi:hypothetical protein
MDATLTARGAKARSADKTRVKKIHKTAMNLIMLAIRRLISD